MLDQDLRRFLFQSGIDYPFSQPRSPKGQVDIAAWLETDDPLVLEVKVWDSDKNYKENRCRDGLRQIIDYADKYGKQTGYVVMLNIDKAPLMFVGEDQSWPPYIERGGKVYYFIAINIAKQEKPISQQDKGQPVKINEIKLVDLWETLDDTTA